MLTVTELLEEGQILEVWLHRNLVLALQLDHFGLEVGVACAESAEICNPSLVLTQYWNDELVKRFLAYLGRLLDHPGFELLRGQVPLDRLLRGAVCVLPLMTPRPADLVIRALVATFHIQRERPLLGLLVASHF